MTDHNWPNLIAAWKKSGMSIEGFAKSKGIVGSTFHYQIKKDKYGTNPYGVDRKDKRTISKKVTRGTSKAHTNGHSFIDLTANAMIEIVCRGVTLRVPTSIEATRLKEIIEALSA